MNPTPILIAEDSPTQAETLREHLTAADFDVTLAADGLEAWGLLEGADDEFAMVLSDVVMPRMDGFELCGRIRAEPDHELPVVLLTSLSDPQDIIRGLEVGADHFLTKPYDPDELVTRLRSILENRALRRAGHLDVGVDVTFLGRRFTITRERQQIVELLVSTFENLIQTNSRLRERETELAAAHDDLVRGLATSELERARIQAVLSAIPDAVIITDASGVVTDVNTAAEDLLNQPAESLRGADVYGLGRIADARGNEIPTEDWPIHRALVHGEPLRDAEDFTLLASDGRRTPVSITAAPIHDQEGDLRAAVSLVRDTSLAALHDSITRLPNRTLFADRLHHALARPDRGGDPTVVGKILLDQFGDIRSSLGQDAADELVVIAAKRIARRLRPEATLARTGAGEFSVLLEAIDPSDAVHAITRAVAAFERPIMLASEEVYVTTSTGLTVAGAEADDPETVLQQARTAMVRALDRDEVNIEMFDPSLHDVVLERLRLDRDLHVALEEDQFVVHFQPIVALGTRRAVGTEALVRWQHRERGLVPPGEFIPVAERSGMIVPIGMRVLREACRQTVAWQRDGTVESGFGVAVNLSARQFADPDLVSGVGAVLDETDLAPSDLTLEITETAVMGDVEGAIATLDELRGLGIRIAVDDFGTGYSSLGYLMDLPVDIIKIDRSFIRHVGADPAHSAITETAILLGRRLGHDVVAEGIETTDQIEWLLEAGCDLGAGYLLARPAPASDIAPLLATDLPSP